MIRAALAPVAVPPVVGFLGLGVLPRWVAADAGLLTPLFEQSLKLLADPGVVALWLVSALTCTLAPLLLSRARLEGARIRARSGSCPTGRSRSR